MADIHRQAHSGLSSSQTGRDRRRMVRHGAMLTGVTAGAMLVAACGSSGGSSASPGGGRHTGDSENSAATKAAVSASKLTGIGTVLVNSSGRTIYTPRTPAEVNGNIKCTGACLNFWLPVTASTVGLAPTGLPGKLGTVHLSDGTTQLTYDGRPLYTFRLDTAAGQAHGNNYSDSFNGTAFTWQVVTASGKASTSGPAPAPSYSSQSGY